MKHQRRLCYSISIIMMGVFFIISPNSVKAEIITVEAEGSFSLTLDVDSPTVAKEKAREEARRRAAEQGGGVYIKAYSEMQNNIITKDKISMLTGSILNIINEDFKMKPSDDGKTINVICNIVATIDTSKINVEKLLDKEDLVKKIEEQNRRIKELEENEKRIKSKKGNTVEERKKIHQELQDNERQFLIAKYERDIDVYDFSTVADMGKRLEVAEKLIKLDPQNTTAFRCLIANYRQRNDIPKIVSYCKEILATNPTPNLAIEAYSQLGDIYYNEYNDTNTARAYIDKGIALVKQNYPRHTIDELVNGGNVIVKNSVLMGKTNTIRKLYILKSDIVGNMPSFIWEAKVEDGRLIENKIYNIRYETNI